MKLSTALLSLSLAVLPSAFAKKPADYPATYAGGTLPLNHHKVRAALANDEFVFVQGGHRLVVPIGSITGISCGTEVRRRMGAVVLDVVPLMHLGESAERYIGVSWSAPGASAPRSQVLLKLSRGDYRDLLAALEQATGIKAVDTYRVPTVVRYQI